MTVMIEDELNSYIHDIAVIVFTTAFGVDKLDAGNRATTAIRDSLGKEVALSTVVVDDHLMRVGVVKVMELDRATRDGYVEMQVTKRAYRE